MDTPMASTGEAFPPELLRLLGSARRVIDQHLNADCECACCGSIWPCDRAQQAELALAGL